MRVHSVVVYLLLLLTAAPLVSAGDAFSSTDWRGVEWYHYFTDKVVKQGDYIELHIHVRNPKNRTVNQTEEVVWVDPNGDRHYTRPLRFQPAYPRA